MKEAIKTEIVPDADPDLSIPFELEMNEDGWDVVTLKIGENVYRADWLGNIKPFFERAISLWKP